MNLRHVETGLARFTVGSLVVYFPVETWVSWPYGLWHPFYLVDFFAMGLMLSGGLYSLRARPEPAPGLLAAAWGWAAANGWRGTWWRVLDVLESGGETIDRGMAEVWAVGLASSIALGCFGLSLMLVVRRDRS